MTVSISLTITSTGLSSPSVSRYSRPSPFILRASGRRPARRAEMHGEEDERNVSDERDMEAITRGTTYDRRLMVQFFPHSTAIFSGSFPTVFHRAKRSGTRPSHITPTVGLTLPFLVCPSVHLGSFHSPRFPRRKTRWTEGQGTDGKSDEAPRVDETRKRTVTLASFIHSLRSVSLLVSSHPLRAHRSVPSRPLRG